MGGRGVQVRVSLVRVRSMGGKGIEVRVTDEK